jgi:hypothetical protein
MSSSVNFISSRKECQPGAAVAEFRAPYQDEFELSSDEPHQDRIVGSLGIPTDVLPPILQIHPARQGRAAQGPFAAPVAC